jgi:peptidoglycan hydrolase-like protein with peptidoglycan-binding domain
MADINIDSLEIKLTTPVFYDMVSRKNAWIEKNKKNPNLVYLNKGSVANSDWEAFCKLNNVDWKPNDGRNVSYTKMLDMGARVAKWKVDNPNEVLNYVWITKPITPSPPKPIIQKETVYLKYNPTVRVPQVYMFQEIIQKKGYYLGFDVDGKFGDETRKAVIKIQADNNIEQTGGIGCLTWLAGVYAPCPFEGSPSPTEEMGQYLVPTANCQSDNSEIISLAKSLGNAEAIFYYVRDNLNYSFYYNTLRGAVKTLHDEEGDCCDLSHLIVALLRAIGIPARYVHVYDRFTTITCGHVVAEGFINGEWINMDASNDKNPYGAIGGSVLEVYGYFAELPF